MAKQTWKKWKTGLWLTIGIAVLSTLAGITTDMNWRQFLALFGAITSASITTYLMKSPLQDVEEDNESKP